MLHGHGLDVAHLFDRKADAFAAKAALFVAAVGHMIDAEAGHVVDDDTAEVELLNRS